MTTTLNSYLAAALAAAALVAGPGEAVAQTAAEVAVASRPTQVTIHLAGKAPADVRREVHGASNTVCRNAVYNRELSSGDVRWCRQKSAAKALRRYAAMIGARQMAGLPATIVLSSR